MSFFNPTKQKDLKNSLAKTSVLFFNSTPEAMFGAISLAALILLFLARGNYPKIAQKYLQNCFVVSYDSSIKIFPVY